MSVRIFCDKKEHHLDLTLKLPFTSMSPKGRLMQSEPRQHFTLSNKMIFAMPSNSENVGKEVCFRNLSLCSPFRLSPTGLLDMCLPLIVRMTGLRPVNSSQQKRRRTRMEFKAK